MGRYVIWIIVRDKRRRKSVNAQAAVSSVRGDLGLANEPGFLLNAKQILETIHQHLQSAVP